MRTKTRTWTTFTASILLILGCNSPNNQNTEQEVITPTIDEAPILTYKILKQIPHDSTAFTQGFLVHDNYLLEGTGIAGETRISKIDTASGSFTVLKKDYSPDIFGEGITIMGNKLYQLTYKNQLIYVFDMKNLNQPIKTFPWDKEGWGITHDSTSLILSDGTSKLYFLNPENMEIQRELLVQDHTGEIVYLNELEYIDGAIFANVWGEEMIYKIDPKTGHVIGKISFEGIIQRSDKNFFYTGENVLNGLAWDPSQRVLFVTGKNWPYIFKIKLDEN